MSTDRSGRSRPASRERSRSRSQHRGKSPAAIPKPTYSYVSDPFSGPLNGEDQVSAAFPARSVPIFRGAADDSRRAISGLSSYEPARYSPQGEASPRLPGSKSSPPQAGQGARHTSYHFVEPSVSRRQESDVAYGSSSRESASADEHFSKPGVTTIPNLPDWQYSPPSPSVAAPHPHQYFAPYEGSLRPEHHEAPATCRTGMGQTEAFPLTSPPPKFTTRNSSMDAIPMTPPSPRPTMRHLSVHDPPRPSSRGLGSRMDRLSVGGNEQRPSLAGGRMPSSPYLEAYKGTYQQMSPMPSPIMFASSLDDRFLPPLAPLDSLESSSGSSRPGRRAKIYDPAEDARDILAALSHSRVKPDPLIDILPSLTHDQILELRSEYKKLVKVQGRGVNVAKHIKTAVPGTFGKLCYVTALGRWESEAYWANYWCQNSSCRRELLVETLMGRTNAEIREIKQAFRDKKYDDSLVRCMDRELKADKFRMAVLLALEERRQEGKYRVFPASGHSLFETRAVRRTARLSRRIPQSRRGDSVPRSESERKWGNRSRPVVRHQKRQASSRSAQDVRGDIPCERSKGSAQEEWKSSGKLQHTKQVFPLLMACPLHRAR